jgi:hypothetical protein
MDFTLSHHDHFCLLDGDGPAPMKAFYTELGVEGLDHRIISRRAWAADVQFDLVRMSPDIGHSTGEHGAITHPEKPRHTTNILQVLQHLDDMPPYYQP